MYFLYVGLVLTMLVSAVPSMVTLCLRPCLGGSPAEELQSET